jgi:hypothetical protein
MRAQSTGRTRSRSSKFACRRRSSAKTSGKSGPELIVNEETIDVEPVPSLLLSSLKYWEVERDLIEERLAAVHEREQ